MLFKAKILTILAEFASYKDEKAKENDIFGFIYNADNNQSESSNLEEELCLINS